MSEYRDHIKIRIQALLVFLSDSYCSGQVTLLAVKSSLGSLLSPHSFTLLLRKIKEKDRWEMLNL